MSQDGTSSVVEFFKDGERVKSVPTKVPLDGFYGVVGMMSKGEKIKISPPMVTRSVEFSQVWEVCTPHAIKHHNNGLCSYVGPGDQSEDSIGTVRMKTPIDPLGPVSSRSFEIRIIDPGEKVFIAIGMCSQSYPHNMLPGWKEISVGYHADNGSLFHSCEDERPTNHPCKKGDTMRCTVHPVDGSPKQVMVVFHRNDQMVGRVTAWMPERGFYGCFGMMSNGECVQVVLPEIIEPYTPPKRNFLDVWQVVTPHLQYQENGVFVYTGKGGAECVGTVRSKDPLDPLSPRNTFEVKILDPGESCYIALGVCSPSYPATLLPGWEDISVGFHADNGLILNSAGGEVQTGCTCVKGDVLRCTVEPVDGGNKQSSVVFHHNMAFIGKVLIWMSKDKIYAQVGTMSKGEVIQVASPQTEPSSLKPDTPVRSMSVPAARHPAASSAMAQTQYSVQEATHTTTGAEGGRHTQAFPHVHSEEHLGERHYPHHPFTAPIPPHPDYRGHPHRMPFHPPMYPHPHFRHPYHGMHPAYFHHFYHPHMPFIPAQGSQTRPPGRNYPNAPLIPYEDATSASPLPSQLTEGHPLGPVQGQQTGLHLPPPDARYNPFYASQASVASSASESDAHYRSQTSTESHSEEEQHKTIQEKASSPPPRPVSPAPQVAKKPTTLHPHDPSPQPPGDDDLTPCLPPDHKAMEGAEMKTPMVHLMNPPGEYPDSPVTPSKHPPEKSKEPTPVPVVVIKEVVEPVHHPITSAGPLSIPIVSKAECRLCRVLHNISCSESNSLRCTLPADSKESSFAMCRLQLTEKMPYFEVTLEHYKANQNVLVGLVTRDHLHTILPGASPQSAAYHTATGSLLVGGQEGRAITGSCAEGDVIGCRVEWTYKLEVSSANQECRVNVEWFRNGCSIASETLPLPASGYYPAVAMTSPGTAVSIKHSMGLKPEAYFDSHPLPKGFTNFNPSPHITEKWNCVQNGKVDQDNYVIFKEDNASQPTVIQGCVPFTTVQPYFEVELQHSVSSYSTLSLGALERISDLKHIIPGEAPNSVGLLPLLGFVMRNGSISSALPSAVTTEVRGGSEKVRIGVGVEFHPKIPFHSSSARKVRVFFTINGQQVNSTYTSLPKTGFCPTIAIDSEFRKEGDKLISLQFSQPQGSLPLGLARAPPESFLTVCAMTIAEQRSPEEKNVVKTVQAAVPLSPSHTYFELKIYSCHKTSLFSCGLAPYNYTLSCHPGDRLDSIGFHSNNGCLYQDGGHQVVAPCCTYRGAKLGCGARFPDDGSAKYAEVFFTLNGNMLTRRLVTVPQLGLFPTVGFCTEGIGTASIDPYAADPFPDLKFSTAWSELKNMKADGATLQMKSQSKLCLAKLAQSVSTSSPTYFTVTPLSELNGRVVIGFSSNNTCPLLVPPGEGKGQVGSVVDMISRAVAIHDQDSASPTSSSDQDRWRGCVVDVLSGVVMIQDQSQTTEQCILERAHHFGCGFEPVDGSDSLLFFFTCNDQVVFCKDFNPQNIPLFPIIFASASTTKLSVDACAMWPLQTPIGKGWARFENLVLENSKITHTTTNQRSKIPVGFAQASMPLIPTSSYIEIEVCSRSSDKAIAVGLASRTYPSNTWVGWKSNSIAYHLDDGNLFSGSGTFSHKIGPKIFQGHTLGCGIVAKPNDYSTTTNGGNKVEVFFTVNGAMIVEQKVTVPSGGFYPTICLESPSESVIFHRYSRFPPVQSRMGRPWGNAYSIHQAGMVLEHSCRHKELTKGIPRAFCQASQPFSPEKPYFEVKIVGFSDTSQIQAGAAVQIPLGCRTPNVDSLMYSCTGCILAKTGENRSTSGTERCRLGDTLGCAVTFSDNQPSRVEFYLNNMKFSRLSLSDVWKDRFLYPTILLSHSGDAVVPMLGLPLPQWDRSSLIGWLRSERVRLRGNVVEYLPSATNRDSPGVCQINQSLQSDSNCTFEVEVLDAGEKCTIAIGAAPADYPLNCQPGWERHSVAYHGDDGSLFHEVGHGTPFGPVWRRFDVIGLGVRKHVSESSQVDPEIQVYFTRNGVELGHTTVSVPPTGLFPTVGFHSRGEKVKITLNPSPSLSNFKPATRSWRTLCGIHISQSHDNHHILKYYDNHRKMPRTGTKIALAIYAEPFSEKMLYFEVELLAMGPGNAVGIGVTPKRYPLDHAPGWTNGSVGYHADDGELYHSRDRGKMFGPPAKRGDVIGCGINFIPNNDKQCSVFFTYNRVEIGRVRAAIPNSGFFPSVCLTHKRDKVQVRIMETFKPKLSQVDLHMVGLMRISNCSYSDQLVQFSGGSSSHNPAPGTAQFAVPMHKERNYFAAHILKHSDNIVIGLAVRDYPLKYAPGSTSISMAYDITKGTIRAVFDCDNFHTFTAPVCRMGDTIGCGVIASDAKSEPGFVYFTRNNLVIRKIQFAEIFEDLYPIIGFVPNKRSSALFMDWNIPIFDFPNPLSEC